MITKHRTHPQTVMRLSVTALILAAVGILPRGASAQGSGLEDLREMMSWGRTSLILVDNLEYASQVEGGPRELDAVGWYDGADNRLWFRLKGEQFTTERVGEGRAHLYYGRLITPYFDALEGVRLD